MESQEIASVDALAEQLRAFLEQSSDVLATAHVFGAGSRAIQAIVASLLTERKAHLAPDAHHLFLVVPVANWKEGGEPRERPYALVARRLGAFFGDPRREVDVLSAHVFGYGGDELPSESPSSAAL